LSEKTPGGYEDEEEEVKKFGPRGAMKKIKNL